MIESVKAISLINDRLIILINKKNILSQELEILSQNLNTDPVTISKFNEQILNIDMAIEALQNELLTII